MSEEKAVGAEVKAAEHQGVRVDHPSIVSSIKQCAKEGMSKEKAAKLIGMPMEVIDRIYHEVKK